MTAQAHDTSNQGLQFGQSGGLNFGNFGSDNVGSVEALKPQQPSELEHQPSSQHVGSAPSNQGLDVFPGVSQVSYVFYFLKSILPQRLSPK